MYQMNYEFFNALVAEHDKYKLFAGFSGGADSTALLLMLNDYKNRYGLDFTAVHFNHNLREESHKEYLWCRDFCLKRNIDFISIELNVRENMYNSENLEAAARRLRLDNFSRLCDEHTDAVVVLGHHADDRIENALIRIFRGGNVSSISSMRAAQYINDFLIIRPLLQSSRAEVESYLLDNNVADWQNDASNFDVTMLRNSLRNRLLPGLYKNFNHARSGAIAAMKCLENDAAFIEKEAQKKYDSLERKHDIPVHFFLKLHPALRIRVLRLWLQESLPFFVAPGHELTRRFNTLLEDSFNNVFGGESKSLPIKDSFSIIVRGGAVNIDNANNIINEYTLKWQWQQHDMQYGMIA